MAEGADETIDVLVQLRDELSRQAAKVESAIDGVRNASAKAAPVVDELGDQIDDAGDAAATSAAQTAAYERELKKMTRQAMKAAAANALLQKRIDMMSGRGNKKRGMFGALTASMNLMGFLKMSLIPVILDAVSAVSTLGGALGAMASAGVGALAPIVGIAGVLPGVLTSLLQVVGVGKMAFGGLGDVIKTAFSPASAEQAEKFAAAMKILPPAARNFVLSLSRFKVPLKELKTGIQNALLPSLTRLMQTFRGYMPMVKSSLIGTARVMAVAVGGINRYFRLAQTQKDVGTVLGNNTKVIASFGKIAQSGLKILMDVLVAAGPLLIRMANDAERFFAALAFKSGNRNGLAEWMDRGYIVFQKTLTLVEDMWMALQNISKIGVPLGSEMGDSFLGMAKKFRHFTESEDGVKKIANWFDTMRPVIYEVGRLAADIGKAFAHWSMDPTVIDTLHAMRVDILPNIIDMVDSAAGRFLPAIAKMIGSIFNIITNLFVLPTLFEMISSSLDSVATVVKQLPDPIKNLISLMLTLTTLFKVSGTIGFFKAVIGGAGGGAASMGLLARSAATATGAVTSTTFALAAYRAGAATAAEATGFLATAGMGKLKAAATALSGVLKASLIVALIAVVAAIVQANSAANEMEETLANVRKSFRDTPNADTWRETATAVNETIDAFNNYNSHNPFTALFDGDVWADTGTQIANGWKAIFGGEQTDTIQQRRAKQIEATQGQLKEYAYNIKSIGDMSGYTEDKVREAVEAMKIDPSNWWEASAAVKSYMWVTYEADEATRTVYGSLKIMADKTATVTEKVDAFTAALDALQPKANSLKSAVSSSARGLDGIAEAAIKASKSLPKVGKELKITANSKDSVLDLNDALISQVGNINAVAAAAYKQTNTVKSATDAYRDQYIALVTKVAKGYEEAGLKGQEARDAAKSLIGQYALTPKQVNTVFKQPGAAEALANGSTIEDILKYGIPKSVTSTIKVGVQTPETAWDVAMINYVTGNKELTNPGSTIKVDNTAANTAIDATQNKLNNLDGTYTAWIDVKSVFDTARYAGGPVWPGTTFTVGERGPELFVGNDGTSTMVGEAGQEQRQFPTPGYIVPNHIVSDAASATMTDGNGASRATSGSYEPDPLPPVVVGPVYVNDSVDLQRAVEKGIATADKNRRERKGGR